MSGKIEIVNICSARGVLAGGRAICGNVGCGEPWKCWSEEPCDKKVALDFEEDACLDKAKELNQ